MTQAKTSEVLVSDKISPGLGVRGPYGSGEPLVVRSPWDGGEIATMRTTTLSEADEVLDRARVAFALWRWTPAWKLASPAHQRFNKSASSHTCMPRAPAAATVLR